MLNRAVSWMVRPLIDDPKGAAFVALVFALAILL